MTSRMAQTALVRCNGACSYAVGWTVDGRTGYIERRCASHIAQCCQQYCSALLHLIQAQQYYLLSFTL